MWRTNKTRRCEIGSRPIRIAYLVPIEPSHALLDVLFCESMSRWGGRRTPIITTDGSAISASDWRFLDLWDADIIYNYVALEDELNDRIAHCLAPAIISSHRHRGAKEDHYSLRPEIEGSTQALKSISVLPRLARNREHSQAPVVQILDKERGSEVPRDLMDSFGFVSNWGPDLDLTPYAKRLSFREKGKEKYAPRFRGDDKICYVSEVSELEHRLSQDRGLLFLSQASDMLCPHLNIFEDYNTSWEDRLTIVVGDEVGDRLVFWNGIHRYRSLDTFHNCQILRFGLERFNNEIPEWIAHLVGGQRNRRHFDGNSAPNSSVISSSLTQSEVESISTKLKTSEYVMCSASNLSASDIFDPVAKSDPRPKWENAAFLWSAWSWPTPIAKETVRLNDNEIDMPCVKPWHVADFSLGPTTVGAWASDLLIERIEDHCRYSNETHKWIFPRRLAVHLAARVNNYGGARSPLSPPLRPTERGCLALWDDPQWKRPVVELRSDVDSFHHALVMHHPYTIADQVSRSDQGKYPRIDDVSVSDKGRDLLGVFQFFRNLPEALNFLTNTYLLALIAKLSATNPSDDPKRIAELESEFSTRLKGKELNADDLNRMAKRTLELATRWVAKDAKTDRYRTYGQLREDLPNGSNDNDGRKALDHFLKFLRNTEFLHQGFGWKCERCQHPNWVHLTDMTSSMECAICNKSEDAPVGGNENSHFMLNSFVGAAFAPTSAQGSVIWCLSQLADSARHSFMFVPTFGIKDALLFPKGTDIDVLACVDGKVHLYEVKKSFAGINKKAIEDLIHLAKTFRPDYAGFAIQQNNAESVFAMEDIARLTSELATIDVTFKLLTDNGQQNGLYQNGVPSNLGDTMKWNVW
jgi:hypothetical protein